MTPEDRAAEERRRAEREQATARALVLFHEQLSEEQRASYDENKRVRIRSESGRIYEMDCEERVHNIFLLDDEGRRVREYCICQEGGLPLPDNHLAQKLLLETDEQRFLDIANERILQQAA